MRCALAILLALSTAACSVPQAERRRPADAATREAAHRELIQEVRIGQVLGYGWRYQR